MEHFWEEKVAGWILKSVENCHSRALISTSVNNFVDEVKVIVIVSFILIFIIFSSLTGKQGYLIFCLGLLFGIDSPVSDKRSSRCPYQKQPRVPPSLPHDNMRRCFDLPYNLFTNEFNCPHSKVFQNDPGNKIGNPPDIGGPASDVTDAIKRK